MENIKVYQSPERLRNMIIMFLIIIMGLIYIIFNQLYNLYSKVFYNYNYFRLILVFIELAILMIVIILMIRLLTIIIIKKPFLIFSEEKIISYGLISTLQIYWEEVEYHTYASLNSVVFIVLKLYPNSTYKNKCSSFRKILNNYNLSKVGGEVAFASVFLMDNFSEIDKLISIKTKKKEI